MDNFNYIFKYGSDSIWDGLIDICVSHPNEFVYVTDSVNLKVHKLNFNGLTIEDSCEYYGHDLEYTWGSPAGICYCDGYIYVLDKTNHVLVILDHRDLKYINHFGTVGTSGSSNALLDSPEGVCCDGLFIYIADTGNNRIVKLNRNLSYQKVSTVTLNTPVGIEYDPYENVLLVVNQGDDEVLKISKDLDTEIDSVGSNGTGDGEFDTPEYIAIDDQNFYVTDSGNHRIQVFEKGDMDFLEENGSSGDGNSEYDTPRGICSYKKKLFIVDDNDRIKVISNYKTDRARASSSTIKLGDDQLIVGGSLIIGATETSGQGNVFVEDEPENYETAWTED